MTKSPSKNITICLDANIFLNVWRREADPKTKALLWKSSSLLLKKIIEGRFIALTSITTIMETLHVIRVYSNVQALDWRAECQKAEALLRGYHVEFIYPDALSMSTAYELFWNNQLDPYDAILASVALHEKADVIVSRDEDLRKRTGSIIKVITPEEIVEKAQNL